MNAHFLRVSLACIALFFWSSTETATAQGSKEKDQPVLDLKEPASMTLVQRHTEFIPGSDETLSMTISDITGKMLLVSIRDKWSREVLRETPIGLGEEIQVTVAKRKYALTLSTLDNRLIGDDSACLTISPAHDGKERESVAAGAVSAAYGDVVRTNVSGDLKFNGLTRRGSVAMHIGEQEFSVEPGGWCWITRDEILKIVSASETVVVYRLYQPVPMPRPF